VQWFRKASRVDLVLPFGTEACWRYTVSRRDECVTLWFAKGRPGMPVQVERQVGGELVSRSVAIADGVAQPSASLALMI